MSEDYWDQDTNEVIEEVGVDDGTENTFVRVNGSNVTIEPGASFAEAVKTVAENADFGKFRVFLNGEEVKPSSSPDIFEAGMKAEIRPYDKAAAK